MARLFEIEKVRKFFDICTRLKGSYSVKESEQIYKGYDKNNPHIVCSQRDVFVNRTLNKWLTGKYLILYRKSNLGVIYKQYVYVSFVKYINDMSLSGKIRVTFVDYSNPKQTYMDREEFDFNKTYGLEGEWSNGEIHKKLIEYFDMSDIPEKDYEFIAYDFSKYPKRPKKDVDYKEKIKFTKVFKARTEMEAYNKKKEFEATIKECKGQIMIGELIER